MGDLNKFLGAPVEIDIHGNKIKIYPLKVKDLKLIKEDMSSASTEEKFKIGIELLKKSLNDPTVTNDDIDNMDADVFVRLMLEINKLNGFDEQYTGNKGKITLPS